jgi:hypothetical protein
MAISIKVVHEQSGKVEYERERLLGTALKIHSFVSDSQQPSICLDMGDAGNKNFACAHEGCTMSTKGWTLAHFSINFVFRVFFQ